MQQKFNDTELDILRLRCVKIIRNNYKKHRWFLAMYRNTITRPLSREMCNKIIQVYNEIKSND